MCKKLCITIMLLLMFLEYVDSKSAKVESDPSSDPVNWFKVRVIPLKHVVVELAIFYDTEFAKRFDYDLDKIQKYWEVNTYDLHLRFMTIPSFRTTFLITTLSVYEGQKAHAFYQKNENERSTDALNEYITDFQSWVCTRLATIPDFDIAILITGESSRALNEVTLVESAGAICKYDNCKTENKWIASTVISVDVYPHPAVLLAEKLAIILGAPMDYSVTFRDICDARKENNDLCCIMGTKGYEKAITARFFSTCTNKFLAQLLPLMLQNFKSCANLENSTATAIINSEKLFRKPNELHAYTIIEQCKFLVNNPYTKVELSPNADHCMVTYCFVNSTGKHINFIPLEGSRCGIGNHGRCFRGTCIQHEMHLVNVHTGKCLVSNTGIFSGNDKPVLRDCSRLSTHMLVASQITKELGRELYQPTLLYSTINGPAEKVLTLTNEGRLKFFPKRYPAKQFWYKNKLKLENSDEFILQHTKYDVCLQAAEDEKNLIITADCSGNDETTKWKFVKVNTITNAGVTWFSYNEIIGGFSEAYTHLESSGYLEISVAFTVLVLLVSYLVFWLKNEYLQDKSWDKIKEPKEYTKEWIVKGDQMKLCKVKAKN